MVMPMSVHAQRLAASGVFDGGNGLRVIVYDTTITLPRTVDANSSSRWPGAKGRKDMVAFGHGMYHAYSPGHRLERARITITLRVCRHGGGRLRAYSAYRPTDGDNLLRSCKGLIDGIVRAGLLRDDSDDYLEHGTPQLVTVDTPFEEGLLVKIEELTK